MPSIIIVGGLIFVFVVVSQFGGFLAARKSGPWWLVVLFLLFSLFYPSGLLPLARFVGIQLPSNLFSSVMILFLFFQLLQEAASSTRLGRQVKTLVSELAVKEFFRNASLKNKIETLVVLPVFNEQEALPKVIEDLKMAIGNNEKICCLFVNDGSRDQSGFFLDQADFGLVSHHSTNIGVSGVLHTAFKIGARLNAKHIIQFDGDGQHPAKAIPDLILAAEQSGADLLIGSRFIESNKEGPEESTSRARVFAISLISFFLRLFTGTKKITDPTSGLRLYSLKAFSFLTDKLPDEYPEPESIALLTLKKFKVKEIKVQMKSRQGGVSSLAGLKSVQFMIKVLSALLGLKLRSLFFKRFLS